MYKKYSHIFIGMQYIIIMFYCWHIMNIYIFMAFPQLDLSAELCIG